MSAEFQTSLQEAISDLDKFERSFNLVRRAVQPHVAVGSGVEKDIDSLRIRLTEIGSLYSQSQNKS